MLSIIIYRMTLHQQEHSIGSDREDNISIIHITRARLCSEYEFLYKIFHTYIL
jgi:hypothetical protein